MILSLLFSLAASNPSNELTVELEIASELEQGKLAIAQVPIGAPREVFGEWCGRTWSDRAGLFEVELLGRTVQGIAEFAPEAAVPEILCVDADADGELAAHESLPLSWVDLNGGSRYASADLRSVGLPASWSLSWSDKHGLRATAMTRYHLEGSVEWEGARLLVIVNDCDLDGSFTPGVDTWIAGEEERLRQTALSNAHFLCRADSEPWYLDTRWLRVSGVDAAGALELVVEPAATPRHEFIAERVRVQRIEMFEWFNAERESFVAQYSIDTSRELASEPLEWYYARDLDEARELALAEGKPLFVEFMNDACPWCKRLEWITYPDREVSELLSQCTLVKINKDLDPQRSIEALGYDGVPVAILFDDEGGVRRALQGWSPPSAYARRLAEAFAPPQ